MNPKVSVLIISYNHFVSTTGPCLEALRVDPFREAMQIIVVDNASDATTKENLVRISQDNPTIDVTFNEQNLGFAAANNQMLTKASGEVIILLNSDTIPPPGSLFRLVELVQQNPGLGMIAPVTNASGNEQHLSMAGEDPQAIIEQGQQWCAHARGSFLPSHRLEFSCVAMSRESRQAIGLLDEGFGRGYYEDSDYCQRAQQLRIAMHVVEEVFIYHQGSGSFKTIPKATRLLMAQNRVRFLRKHPQARIINRRRCNLAALWHYVTQVDQGIPVDDVAWRFAKRMQQADGERPGNFLKNRVYAWHLSRVKQAFAQAMAGRDRSPTDHAS